MLPQELSRTKLGCKNGNRTEAPEVISVWMATTSAGEQLSWDAECRMSEVF